MAFLTPSDFRKQSIKYLKDFKTFAKKSVSVAES